MNLRIAVLLGLLLGVTLLVLATTTVVQREIAAAREAAEHDASAELALLADVVRDTLQQSNYEYIGQLFEAWANKNDDVSSLILTSSNGFELGRYQRPDRALFDDSLTLSTEISYSYKGLATLTLEKDLQALGGMITRTVVVAIGGATVLSLLLCSLAYLLLQHHRKAEILDSANASLEKEVSRRRHIEEMLFDEKERAEVTVQSIGDGVITTDARGFVTYANPVAEELAGIALQESQGKHLSTVLRLVDEKTGEIIESPIEQCMRDNGVVAMAAYTALVRADTQKIAIEGTAAPIHGRNGEAIGVVLVLRDVTHTRRLAEQLSWQASHDSLTGLINRREFECRVTRALEGAHHEKSQHAVLFIDLDQFKIVNDTCGHMAGDAMLKQLATLLHERMRSNDTLARIGGDEFGVLLSHCPLEKAEQIAKAILDFLREFRFVWGEKTFAVGGSIGLAVIDNETENLGQVLSNADIACYAAKERGGNRIRIYRDSDAALGTHHREMLWIPRLKDALANDRFELFGQVIAPLGIAAPKHLEVLIRLRGEDGNVIWPGEFVPAAERYNLMPDIDRWVIRTLARDFGKRFLSGDGRGLVSVNLSGTTLSQSDFQQFVHEIMDEFRVNASRLCFEITETAAIANLERAVPMMHDLKARGCRFALDDFGAGLSSFSYLKNMPVDYLKIDGSLVRNIVNNMIDYEMVHSITQIGRVMGLRTIAEYVENQEIRDVVTRCRVDYAQGYAIAKPAPLKAA